MVVSVIGLLTAIGMPAFNKARTGSLNNAKQANVRMLNNAVQMWAMDTLISDSSSVGLGVTNYIKGGLASLNVGEETVNVSNITSRTVGHTFTVDDLY